MPFEIAHEVIDEAQYCVDLHSCETLRDLSPLAACKSLRYLRLHRCAMLEDLSPLVACQHLQRLEFHSAGSLRELGPLAELSTLKELVLYLVPNVTDLAPLAALTELRSLSIHGAGRGNGGRDTIDLAFLRDLVALESLELDFDADADMSTLSTLSRLTDLSLGLHQPLYNGDSLANLSNLRKLRLYTTSLEVDMEAVAMLPALDSLAILGWSKGTIDLGILDCRETLRTLELRVGRAEGLTELLAVAPLQKLHLRLRDQSLDLACLASCTTLRRLTIFSADLTSSAPDALQELDQLNFLMLQRGTSISTDAQETLLQLPAVEEFHSEGALPALDATFCCLVATRGGDQEVISEQFTHWLSSLVGETEIGPMVVVFLRAAVSLGGDKCAEAVRQIVAMLTRRRRGANPPPLAV